MSRLTLPDDTIVSRVAYYSSEDGYLVGTTPCVRECDGAGNRFGGPCECGWSGETALGRTLDPVETYAVESWARNYAGTDKAQLAAAKLILEAVAGAETVRPESEAA